jgi:hypothetical protein
MPTAIYRTRDNERVPSVTTIAGLCKPSAPLMHWAWQKGLDGLDYRQAGKDAADSGTIGHILVDAAIKQTVPDPEDFPTGGAADVGMVAFRAYQEWRKQSNIRWVDSELSMVSEQHRYGGTMDGIGVSENSYVLGDWKTGGLYPEHLIQMAAYGKMFEECTGHNIRGFHLCRFNRDSGDFTHAYFSDLSDAWETFLHLRAVYDLMSKLKKRI